MSEYCRIGRTQEYREMIKDIKRIIYKNSHRSIRKRGPSELYYSLKNDLTEYFNSSPLVNKNMPDFDKVMEGAIAAIYISTICVTVDGFGIYGIDLSTPITVDKDSLTENIEVTVLPNIFHIPNNKFIIDWAIKPLTLYNELHSSTMTDIIEYIVLIRNYAGPIDIDFLKRIIDLINYKINIRGSDIAHSYTDFLSNNRIIKLKRYKI